MSNESNIIQSKTVVCDNGIKVTQIHLTEKGKAMLTTSAKFIPGPKLTIWQRLRRFIIAR